MAIKTDVYLQIGLSKEVFQEFKKMTNLEDWQKTYTLIIFRGGYTNDIQRLIGKLEKLLPLYGKDRTGYKESLMDDLGILYEYEYKPFRLDHIEVYGH